MTTFADEELSKPCDHTIVMCKDRDIQYFHYKCLYCDYKKRESKLRCMNC